MAAKRSGLGRGLGDLLQRTDPELAGEPAANQVAGAWFAEVAVADVLANPKQPRQVFDEAELERLAESIADFGLLQPIVVRPPKDGKYELVMGERRLRAAQLAGLDVIPAIVRETADEDMLRDALLENIHRVQLNPLEQAAAYQQLMRDFGVTQEELAKRLKVSRSQISNTLRLLALPAGAQRRVAAGVLSAGHARALLALDTPEEMEDLAKRIVAEGLSVRSVEELISLRKFDKKRQRTRKMKTVLPETAELQDALEEVLETRVRISGTSRGRIVIDYSGAEDLHRIAELIIKSS